MKKLHETTTAILLTAALLLSGCAEQSNTLAPGADTSSDISESSSSLSEDLENPNNSTPTSLESSVSSESNQDDGDNIDYDSLGMEAISSELDSYYESAMEEYDAYVDDLFASLDGVKEPGDIPVEFTDKDMELQAILNELDRGVCAINTWITTTGPFTPDGRGYVSPEYFIMNENDDRKMRYRPIPNNYRIYGLPVPTTSEEMREMVMEYFTEDYADNFMNYHVSAGSMTENPDGTYSVTFDENRAGFADFMELDGRLYWQGDSVGGRGLSPFSAICRSAKVISWTEDTIVFSFLEDTNIFHDSIFEARQSDLNDVTRYEEHASVGVLKYERGGWRRDYNK